MQRFPQKGHSALSGHFSALESAGCQSNRRDRTIVDPRAGGQPFANSQVPVSRFNPASLKLNAYLPASADPCGKVTYGIPTTGDEDQASDLNPVQQPGQLGRQEHPGDHSAGNLMRSQSFTIGDTYSISPTTLNALRTRKLSCYRKRMNYATTPFSESRGHGRRRREVCVSRQ